jgi:hypothetical protein
MFIQFTAMIAIFVAICISGSPPPDLPSDLHELKSHERKLRARLNELHGRCRDLQGDAEIEDLSALEEAYEEIRGVESELALVMGERARQRAQRLGRPPPGTEKTRFNLKDAGRHEESRAPPRSNRGLIRFLALASVATVAGAAVLAVKLAMAPHFEHKKDEDLAPGRGLE